MPRAPGAERKKKMGHTKRILASTMAMATLAAKVLSHDLSSEYIIIKHTKKARFIFDEPETWTFDGENGGAHSDICFENCPQAITLIY